MTKEVLELAKSYDGDIRAINKALEVLSKGCIRVYSNVTGDEFRISELDTVTVCKLLDNMTETLEARKQKLTEELERL